MSSATVVRSSSAPNLPAAARGAIRWVCTKNPFYVVSAGLFLAGLKISFGDAAQAQDTWAMMGGLAGYTLLLAGAACLLVRFANVWDDVRTVLLLVVLMFLATSVTFDEVLVLDWQRGVICYLAGGSFAVLVSEGILRGIRLKLPAGFRAPYYLILALFFLYPLALRPLVDEPHSEVLLWGLFGFAPLAGLVFLTLLPAIRRGPGYVRGNGSPWPWPLYPWSLFVFLAVAVPARSFLLCWSMHLLGNGDRDSLVFGPYFLVPFGLAVAVLLLELGLTARNRVTLVIAMALPLGLAGLALVGHRTDPIYQQFLDLFAVRLGVLPASLTLLIAVAFYIYAAGRRVPGAPEALTAALLVLAVVGPDTLRWGEFVAIQPAPLLAAGAMQLGLGVWRRASWRCLAGCAAIAVGLAFLDDAVIAGLRLPVSFHLALLAMLLVGALFDDAFAHWLRSAAAVLMIFAGLTSQFFALELPTDLPVWIWQVYPLFMATVLGGYGWLLHHRLAQAGAVLVFTTWLIAAAWHGYLALRHFVRGLDYLVLSLAVFALAVLISLGKSGLLARWIGARHRKAPAPTE